MKVIGVTGGVGSGKSVVLSILEKDYHAETILADLVAHDLMQPGGKSYEDIAKDPVCEKTINGHTCKAHGKHHTQIPCWVTGVLASFIYGKRKYGKSEPAYYPQYDQLGKDICAYMIQGHGNGGYDLYLVLAQSKGSGRSHDVIIGPLCPSLYMEKGIPSGHLQ